MATTRDVLERALEIVRDRGWTRGISARRADGAPAPYNSPHATRWCASGAIGQAAIELGTAVGVDPWRRLQDVVGGPLIHWNDHVASTVDDVIAAFKEAIVNCPLEEGT